MSEQYAAYVQEFKEKLKTLSSAFQTPVEGKKKTGTALDNFVLMHFTNILSAISGFETHRIWLRQKFYSGNPLEATFDLMELLQNEGDFGCWCDFLRSLNRPYREKFISPERYQLMIQ